MTDKAKLAVTLPLIIKPTGIDSSQEEYFGRSTQMGLYDAKNNCIITSSGVHGHCKNLEWLRDKINAAAPADVEVLKKARSWIAEQIKEMGDCDHSVGICMCADLALLEKIDAAIAAGAGTGDGWIPVAEWKPRENERVQLYIVHDNARFESDPNKRAEEWEAQAVGYWTGFNSGGWVWNGLCGHITHVRPLPAPPSKEA
jgi:hypothetical protein